MKCPICKHQLQFSPTEKFFTIAVYEGKAEKKDTIDVDFWCDHCQQIVLFVRIHPRDWLETV